MLQLSVTLLVPGGSDGKESAYNAEDPGSIRGSRISHLERKRLSTPVFLPGESHGQRNRGVVTAHVVSKSQARLSTHTSS